MARQNKLLRLRKNLLACRERLGKELAGELAYLHDGKASDATGDSADLAFEAASDEMSSLLAELDTRGIKQIDQALARWRKGLYGICSGDSLKCQKKIPAARLDALPYTTLCINCERELEGHSDLRNRRGADNWNQVADAQAPMQDQPFNLGKLELDLSGKR